MGIMFTGSNRTVACITLMHFSLTEYTTIAPLSLWRYVFITYFVSCIFAIDIVKYSACYHVYDCV